MFWVTLGFVVLALVPTVDYLLYKEEEVSPSVTPSEKA